LIKVNRPPVVAEKAPAEDIEVSVNHSKPVADAIIKTREDLVDVYKESSKLLSVLTEHFQKKKNFRATAVVTKRDSDNRISSISLDMEEI
jgi:hypothetical protein